VLDESRRLQHCSLSIRRFMNRRQVHLKELLRPWYNVNTNERVNKNVTAYMGQIQVKIQRQIHEQIKFDRKTTNAK